MGFLLVCILGGLPRTFHIWLLWKDIASVRKVHWKLYGKWLGSWMDSTLEAVCKVLWKLYG